MTHNVTNIEAAADYRMAALRNLKGEGANLAEDHVIDALNGIAYALLAIEAQLAQISANTDTFNAKYGHPRHRVGDQ